MRPLARTADAASCDIVRTRCDAIDDALRGGVRTRQITEIVGESGAAKTQLCAQIALFAQIDLRCSCVYVHTESKAPVDVMRRLASSERFARAFGSGELARAALERVYVVKALGDGEGLRATLEGVSAVLRAPIDANAPVRVIVVDSAAAPFRDGEEDDGWSHAQRRAGTLHKMTMLLKEYATVHDLAVITTNHVVDVIRAGEGGGVGGRAMAAFETSGRDVVPALGLMWANCVNTRLFLTRHDVRGRASDREEGGDGVKRRLHVVYAPHLRETSVEFILRDDGVQDATSEVANNLAVVA